MIDWAQIAELRDVVEGNDFRELVRLFFVEVEDILDRLEGCQALSSVESDLHFLSGSAVTLGFSGLARLCVENRQAVLARGIGALDMEGLRARFDVSRKQFLLQLVRSEGPSLAGTGESAYGARADTIPESAACPHRSLPRRRSFSPTPGVSTHQSS